jgi:hypothetical protein
MRLLTPLHPSTYLSRAALTRLIQKILLLIICLGLLGSCESRASSKSDDGSSSSSSSGECEGSFLNFRVTGEYLGETTVGIIVGISIFDMDTGQRLVRGNTGNDGWFYSLTRLKQDVSVRIELYTLPGDRCIGWVSDLTEWQNPVWWSDLRFEPSPWFSSESHYHLGYFDSWDFEDFGTADGNWGP